MLGVGKQISHLLEASKGPANVGAKATQTALHSAESVAIGADRKVSALVSDYSAKVRPRSAIRGSIHPGSTAGYKGEKPIHLNFNNTGYDRRDIQKARYSKPDIKYPNVMSATIGNRSSYRNTDFRIGRRAGDSPSRLKRRG